MAVRTKFTQYRGGSTATPATLNPGWLTVYNRAVGPLGSQGLASLTSGQIDFRPPTDLRLGDILKDILTGRFFQVVQIEDMPASRRAFVSEIFLPVPDDFDSGVIEKFWSQTLVSASLFTAQSTGRITLSGGPNVATPGAGSQMVQSLTGDFDVWSKVEADTGGGGTPRYVLIGAYDSNGAGCYMGIKNAGSPLFYRIDEISLGSVSETLGDDPVGAMGFVRLKRVGKRFVTYYSLSTTEPQSDYEWTQINAPLSPYTSVATMSVGLFGFCNGSTGSALYWEFFRNWKD